MVILHSYVGLPEATSLYCHDLLYKSCRAIDGLSDVPGHHPLYNPSIADEAELSSFQNYLLYSYDPQYIGWYNPL